MVSKKYVPVVSSGSLSQILNYTEISVFRFSKNLVSCKMCQTKLLRSSLVAGRNRKLFRCANLSQGAASLVLSGACLPSRGLSLLVCSLLPPDWPFRQERSCNYSAIAATIRKMPSCLTDTFTSHAVISFFIIPSVTFLRNGMRWVCLEPSGHRDAARALRRLSSHIAVHVRGGLISFQSSSLARLVPSQPLCFRFDSACVLPDEAANCRCRSVSWVSVCSWSSQWSHLCLIASF